MMKRLVITLIAILAATTATITVVPAQERNARMVFDSQTHDFGTIKEIDGDVSCTFKFKNDGALPLVINSVGVSCGCTTPKFSKEPVLPGKTGEIAVTFDPTNRPGRFEKVINIMCTDPRRNLQLTITGNVVPRPRTIQDDYPYSVADGLRIADRSLVLGTLPRGRVTVRTLGMANGGKTPLQVGIGGAKQPPYLTVKPKKTTLAPGERSEIVLTYDATKLPDLWGKKQDAFGLTVNGKALDEEIDLTAVFAEDFGALSRTELQRAPRADYSSFFYHFSDQPQGKALSRQFQISNGGTNDLIIRYLGPTSGRVKATMDRSVIKAGDTATLTVTLDSKGVNGRLSEGVTVVTNDPARPARDIRVMANIVL